MRRVTGFVPLVVMTTVAVGAAVVGAVQSPSTPLASSSTTTMTTSPFERPSLISPNTSTTLPSTSGEKPVPTTTTTTTAAPSSGSSPLATCAFSDLVVAVGASGVATGHWGQRVSFRNGGTTTCMLYGYPGVALLNASGVEVAQATRTLQGFIGGLQTGWSRPPTAILAPGQTATAVIEGTDVPTVGGITSCPAYTGMLVTPPTSRQSVHFATSLGSCSPVQVHPVIATTSLTTTPGSTRGWTKVNVTQLSVLGMTVPEAAALTLRTGRSLEFQVMGEQGNAAVVPDTIISQGPVSRSLSPSPKSSVLVNVTVAAPPAPPCRATQLAMAFLGGQGFGGNDSGFLVVRDTSARWCSLNGPVQVWGQATTGRVVTDKLTEPIAVPVGLSPLARTPEPLIAPTAPGTLQAVVEFAANENGCIPPYPTQPTPTVRVTPAALDLSLPGGTTLTAPDQSYTKEGFAQFIACNGRFLTKQPPTAVTVRG